MHFTEKKFRIIARIYDSTKNIEGAGRTPQPFKFYSRRNKGQSTRKGSSDVWGLAADAKVGGEDTCSMVVNKRESSPILKDKE